jgi:xanthine dehydrogenase YagS FAD-binding subunit
VPQLRDGLVHVDRLVEISDVVPRGVRGTTIGAGTTLAELEHASGIPEALREACRLAASPQLRNMGTIGGNLLQSTRCWYWRLQFPCRLHGGDVCHARAGQHREHAIFANDFCASAHPSDPAAALLALDARVRTDRREFPLDLLYRLPTQDDRSMTTLEEGELILELEVKSPLASAYLKAMDRKRWAFALVGVAAARYEDGVRLALAGVAPIPWALDSLDALEAAEPLPGNAYKVELAQALGRRAITSVTR